MVAPAPQDYLERIDSVSPSSAGFSITGGRAVMPFLLEAPLTQDIQDGITQILGGISTGVSNGGVERTLPLAHPVYPWMYASSIQSIRGIGNPSKVDALQGLEAPPFPNFAYYRWYELMIEFTPRTYALLQNSSVPVSNNNNYFEDDGTEVEGITYVQEWLRFTDYEILPQYDNITANLGFMVFQTQSGSTPGGNGTSNVQWTGQPRIFLPNQIIKFYWYQVPYRYFTSTNSILTGAAGTPAVGHINQNDWYNWKAGQLLLLSVTPKRYTPPVPEMNKWYTAFSTEKWCDVEFTFLYTTRVGTDTPQGTGVPGRPDMQYFIDGTGNANWLAAGHNLLPWLQTREFYYGTSVNPSSPTDPDFFYPSFPSVPFELLFQDPDLE